MPLFSRTGLQALRAHLAHPMLFVFDFDGVVAPLISARDKARPRAATLPLLRRLAREHTVAVVSGRGRKDVKDKLGFRPDFLVGNHGVEGIAEFADLRTHSRRISRAWKRTLAEQLPPLLGIDVEDKSYSLSVHYRQSARPRSALKTILKIATRLRPPPRVVLGKMVVNLVLPRAPHKGTAVRHLMKKTGFTRALFVGDDWTDEDVFRLRDPRIFGIRVGRNTTSHAPYYLKDQLQMDRLLREILRSV